MSEKIQISEEKNEQWTNFLSYLEKYCPKEKIPRQNLNIFSTIEKLYPFTSQIENRKNTKIALTLQQFYSLDIEDVYGMKHDGRKEQLQQIIRKAESYLRILKENNSSEELVDKVKRILMYRRNINTESVPIPILK